MLLEASTEPFSTIIVLLPFHPILYCWKHQLNQLCCLSATCLFNILLVASSKHLMYSVLLLIVAIISLYNCTAAGNINSTNLHCLCKIIILSNGSIVDFTLMCFWKHHSSKDIACSLPIHIIVCKTCGSMHFTLLIVSTAESIN